MRGQPKKVPCQLDSLPRSLALANSGIGWNEIFRAPDLSRMQWALPLLGWVRYPHPPISLYPQVEKIYNVNNRHYWVVTLGQAMYVLYRCEMPSLNPEGAQRLWRRIIFIQNVTIPSCLHSKELPSDYLRIIYRLSNLFPQKEIWHHFTIKQKKDQGCDYLLYLIVGSSQAKAIRAQGDRSFNIF